MIKSQRRGHKEILKSKITTDRITDSINTKIESGLWLFQFLACNFGAKEFYLATIIYLVFLYFLLILTSNDSPLLVAIVCYQFLSKHSYY